MISEKMREAALAHTIANHYVGSENKIFNDYYKFCKDNSLIFTKAYKTPKTIGFRLDTITTDYFNKANIFSFREEIVALLKSWDVNYCELTVAHDSMELTLKSHSKDYENFINNEVLIELKSLIDKKHKVDTDIVPF
jgi:hypothetical protein